MTECLKSFTDIPNDNEIPSRKGNDEAALKPVQRNRTKRTQISQINMESGATNLHSVVIKRI